MSSQADPSILNDRLVAGETDALAELFEIHRGRLWRMINFRMDGRLRGRLSADDILQDAYLAAEKRLAHYAENPFDSPFVWLRMIAHQTLIAQHRRHIGAQARDAGREAVSRRRFDQTTSASLMGKLTGGLTSPSMAAVRAERFGNVEQAIEGMEPIDREVLALRHFEELTNAEVAEELGITTKTASIRYVRALRRLRGVLSDASDPTAGDLHA